MVANANAAVPGVYSPEQVPQAQGNATMRQDAVAEATMKLTPEHEMLLQLGLSARDAEKSPLWKVDLGEAAERHGEACEALWAELYRQLDRLSAEGNQVTTPAPLRDPVKEANNLVVAHLRKELPALVSLAMENFDLARAALSKEPAHG